MKDYRVINEVVVNIEIGENAMQFTNDTLKEIILYSYKEDDEVRYGYDFMFKSGKSLNNYGSNSIDSTKSDAFTNLMYFLKERKM